MKRSIFERIEEDGYAIVEDFLLPNEIDELRTAGGQLCQNAPEENRKVFDTINSANAQSKDKYFLESGDKVSYFFESGAFSPSGELLVDASVALNKVGHALHTDVDAFKKFTFSNRVREICWQLGYRRPAVCQSMYIYKNPGVGGEVKAHQDATYLYTNPPSAVGFWIALDDAMQYNGCLQFIKGSHRSGVHRRYIRNPDPHAPELLVYDKAAPIYPASNFVSVPVRKGSLVLIHSLVVHRSEPNRSDKSRHAYTFHVIETENVHYSKDNWLQPTNKAFPVLYEVRHDVALQGQQNGGQQNGSSNGDETENSTTE